LRDYGLHMRMFAFLKSRYPQVPLSLHAGELALGLTPPRDLRFHIREAVEVAGARRIGHGVDIAYEDGALPLLARMAREHIAVEINLTSNDVILGVKGAQHPLALYRAAGVPVVLATDDAGVSRGDLTQEYVRAVTEQFVRLMEIDPVLHAPPILIVAWASLNFRCVLTKASQKFLFFMQDGSPVRARISASFTEFIDAEHEALKVKRETADYTKRHVVLQGETIAGIASKYYGDPALWRPIAVLNELDEPRRLSAGMLLTIPSLPFQDRATGETLT